MEKFKQFELLEIEAQENTQKNAEKKAKKVRYPCKIPCKKCGELTIVFRKQPPEFPICSNCSRTEGKPISTVETKEKVLPPVQQEIEEKKRARIEHPKEVSPLVLTAGRSSYILAQEFQHKMATCSSMKMLEEVGQKIKACGTELRPEHVEMLRKKYSERLKALKGSGK